jgi:NAD(P)-dependent dehydrogenase (short-subunit alcohol dehydrogenase family)
MKNRIVAITGGNSGIGLSTTSLFLKEGYKVAIFAQSIDTLKKIKATNPENIYIFAGNVATVADLENFYKGCFDLWGQIDTVVANAGIAKPQNIEEVTESSFDETININVKGVFFTVQKALPYLNSKASMVLVSSIQAQKGAGIWSVYGASKASVRSLTRSFAQELGAKGIRVNTISPGVTETPIFDKFGFGDNLPSILDSVKSSTPLGRIGEPDEIAKAIYFLASESASFITGSDLQVDGGLAQI